MTTIVEEILQSTLGEQSNRTFVQRLIKEADRVTLAVETILLEEDTDQQKTTHAGSKTQELVLDLYEKLTNSLEDSASQEYARELQDEYILVGATLFDLATVFSKTNPDRVRALLTELCKQAPWLLSEIEASLDLFIEQVVQFQDRQANSVHVHQQHTDTDQFIESLCADIELQLSLASSWLCLAEFCQPAVLALVQDKRYIIQIARTWEIVSKQMQRVSIMANQGALKKAERVETLARKLKWQWCGLAFCILQWASKHDSSRLPSTERETFRSTGYTVLLDILDSMETADTLLVPFVNSPFLLDMEFRFGLRRMLATITSESALLDEAQLDYLTMSIDQLVCMMDPLYNDGLDALTRRIHDAQTASTIAPDIAQNEGDIVAVSNESDSDGEEDLAAILQIKELIPDLGAGFIRACLDYYGHDSEAVVMALLEDNLPPSLAGVDRSTESWAPTESTVSSESGGETASFESASSIQPEASSILEARRNVFDKDEFDIFNRESLDWSRVSQGKLHRYLGVNVPDSQAKSRIMEIAQRMENEDEYDDTYDEVAQDGVIDTPDADDLVGSDFRNPLEGQKEKRSSDAQAPVDDPTHPWEETLVRQYLSDPKVLEKNKASRKLPARQALRMQTGLSDEQLEGWYIMFQRSPRKKSILGRYEWRGGQNYIEPSTPVSDALARSTQYNKKSNSAKEGSQQRPADAKAARPDYNRKEKQKAKVANHNRKKQHDRKTRHIMPSTT
ncbi:hypothetical protein BX070DRAFT_254945 [Coemansia spiralis]|nr:hypothetical protein BX070DRAFT_254945 [Coemansia spiralis]